MNPASQVPIRIIMPDGAPKIIRKEQLPDQRQIVVLPIRAASDRRLTAGLWRVLAATCGYCNKAGMLWAGLERIGKDIGISTQATHVHMKKLERLGYVRIVYQGFCGERAATRQVIFNPDLSPEQTMQKTETYAPYAIEKQQRAAKKAAKKKEKQQGNNRIEPNSSINVQEVEQSSMQDMHDVMRLKNKVSDKIWQLATARANSETDYAAIKAAIDKLLR